MPAVPAPPLADTSIEQWFIWMLMIGLVAIAIYAMNLQKQIRENFQAQIQQQKICAEEIKRQVDEKTDRFNKIIEDRDERCNEERVADTQKHDRLIAELRSQNAELKTQITDLRTQLEILTKRK